MKMMDRIRAAIPEAERVCRAVAPLDLAGLPLYIVPLSNVPGDRGGACRCLGYTSTSLDLYLRDRIHKWQGRGPCMAIHDFLIYRLYTDNFEASFLGTVLHELAHILVHPTPYKKREFEQPEQRVIIAQEARRIAEDVSVDSPPVATPEWPWRYHEGKFLRAAFHVWHRAKGLGAIQQPSQIWKTESYGLSPATAYADVVEDEATRMAEAPFREIMATPFPAPLSRLWTDDVVRYLNTPELALKESA